MCLGIPAQVVGIVDAEQQLATVDIGGVRRTISLRLVAEDGVDVGGWVLVHVGFAMAVIDEEEAAATLDLLAQMGRAYADELDAYESSGV